MPVPRPDYLDLEARRRIAGHLRHLFDQHRFRSIREMAKALDVDPSALNRAMRGDRSIGLDMFLRIHRSFKVSLDYLADRDPPAEYMLENAAEEPKATFVSALERFGKASGRK